MGELLTYTCNTQDFLGGKLQKKFLDKIIAILKTLPVDQTMIEIKLLQKMEGNLIERQNINSIIKLDGS